MNHNIKTILFASDLSVNMKQVFEYAAAIGVTQEANIVVLHVMEENHRSEKRMLIAFGEKLYKNLKSRQKSEARNILIGKNVDALRIKNAITGFLGDNENVDASKNDSLIGKILVTEGRSIADEITATAREENCDIIFMGCQKKGLLADAMGDHVVRKVLKRSGVPVFVVPF